MYHWRKEQLNMLGTVALILGLIGGFVSLIGTGWKCFREWVWNRLPAVRQLKKDQEKYTKLCQAAADHLALLKSLIDEIEDGCIQETLACLQDMRVTSDQATETVLYSLRQRLEHVIFSINNEAAVRQTSHNRKVKGLENETDTLEV
jgi:hypothetical protein